MFYDHAELWQEGDGEMPLSVGISKPDNRMVMAWGDKRFYMDEEEMKAVITTLLMTYEQWMRERVSGLN